MTPLESPSLAVPPLLDRLGRLVGRHPKPWIALGNFETKLLADDLPSVHSPVYISGLARSGSTLLLEILASHRDVATHRYADFPFLFTPYWWNTVRRLTPFRNTVSRERAHGDGIMVTPESPEAMEEMLWMAFFSHCHDAARSQMMPGNISCPPFEDFYRAHIRKLLRARRKPRYVSKGNYNLTRLPYLQAMFEDARFIIPVRAPAAQIESLMRQHARFCAAGEKDRRIAIHMSLAGHFEFGPGRIPIHTGDGERVRQIEDAWNRGEEVRGWALYWDMLYGAVHRQMEGDARLKQSSLVVRFETLCDAPADTIRRILAHCGLTADEDWIARHASAVRLPGYYRSALSDHDRAVIDGICAGTAALYAAL